MKLVNMVKGNAQKLLAATALILGAGVANAQTSGSGRAADFQSIFTGAAADFATIMGYAITLAVAVWGGLVVFKLAKKLYNKAT